MSQPQDTPPVSARRYFALLAIGLATFTVLGSLVPFDFEGRPWGEARAAFVTAMTARIQIESKSDAVVNVMLGIPLGFALLGMLCADRPVSRVHASLFGVLLLPACVVFSMAVEFAQLYANRTCSGADVIAQTLGAFLGVLTWLVCGQTLTNEVRKATTGQGAAARFLVAYVVLLGFAQALPLDFSASPADAYRKFRDGGVKPIPFGEFRTLEGNDVLGRMATLLKLGGLYFPLGLLAGRVPGRFWAVWNFKQVFLMCLGFALCVELGQVLVKSRTTSATDVVIGGTAAFVGWLIVKADRPPSMGHASALLMGWVGVVGWISFQPFDMHPVRQPFDWVPGTPLEGGNPLVVLEEIVIKLVLFGLLGVLVAVNDMSPPTGWLVILFAVGIGLLFAGLFEAGQTRVAGHTPCITDVLLGGVGAGCGAWVATKVRTGETL